MNDRPHRRGALLVGAGTVGGPLGVLLALADVELTLVDVDVVEAGNLERQLYTPAEVGQPKAVALARRIRALRPALAVHALVADARSLGAAVYADFDVVFAAVDSLSAEAWLGQMTALVGATLIRPATAGERPGCGSATVRCYPADGGVCPECWWGADAYALATARERCGSRVEHNPAAGAAQSAEDGFLAASLAMKAFLHGPTAAVKVQIEGALDAIELRRTSIEAGDDCPSAHRAVALIEASPTSDPSLDALFPIAAARLNTAPDTCRLDLELQPLEAPTSCIRCGHRQQAKFAGFPPVDPRCPACDAELAGAQVTSLARAELGALASIPIAALSPPRGWAGLFRGPEGAVWIQPGTAGG